MTPEQYVQEKAAASGSSLLLRLPVPAQAAPRRHHRLLCVLPRGGRRGGRDSDPGVAAAKLAWWRQRCARLCRPAQPPGDAGADAAGRRFRHRAGAPAGGDRGLPDGPGADPLPRLCRPAALLPPGGRRGRRGRGQHLRPDRGRAPPQYAHRLGLALQLTNIIRDVGDDALRGRIYLPMSRTAAVRRQGARDPEARRPGATASASPR